ncbi:homoserine dehydrogenase [Desulfurivibrio alkaliphilus]|uniref:Homoserine dehydrogenase n=1 Tax=Desulfurivibrio alkaliphilus (strain DSM 19089 / UNIQEM U267 / AHT2) TaxID=589865 RepID=D6Z214_DESAT|nr:homoserine dehydrogenase [Desulfurivibrio alkaliphilus]ADH85589.1 Homoserine dehydrogenase [Desulfurivibrio alkaliphilus AHT 2]
MREIRVGLIGFGTVGSGTAEVLRLQRERLQRKTGADVRLHRVADIAIEQLPPEFAEVELTRDADEVVAAPDIDIVVELIGGIEPAKTFILKAIAAGKHVVTANKALISQHGREIFAAAAAANVEVGFEASVGGGIPVIKALKEGLVANRIESIIGIMNGTANYILNRMTDEGLDFNTVLKDAQAHGYAEADPTYDVEGIDTAHKLVILMSMAYGVHLRLDQVSTEGISNIEPVDIEFAREFGYRIKLLAISRNHGDSFEARVHPTMVPNQELLANIGGAFNAIQFTGDMVDDVLLYGQGAGKMPTGSAVVADIVDIARNILNGAINRVPSLSYLPENLREAVITPLASLRCPYYFRVTVQDKPGVLSAITGILGRHGISIQSVLQQGREEKGVVPVMMRAYEAEEEAVRAALKEIDALEVCAAPTVKIRIMEDE